MRRNVDSIVKGLRKGVKVNTNYGITRVPLPTASSMVFHKTKKEDTYVILQAQSELLKGKITYEEVDLICRKSAEIVKISHEKFIITLGRALLNITLFFGVMMIPVPLIIANTSGLLGFLIATFLYILILVLLNFLRLMW